MSRSLVSARQFVSPAAACTSCPAHIISSSSFPRKFTREPATPPTISTRMCCTFYQCTLSGVSFRALPTTSESVVDFSWRSCGIPSDCRNDKAGPQSARFFRLAELAATLGGRIPAGFPAPRQPHDCRCRETVPQTNAGLQEDSRAMGLSDASCCARLKA